MIKEKETYKKRLIEIGMPLEIINKYSKTKGYHTGIHLWWARRPLATAVSVILGSLIEDPGNYLPEKEAQKERKKIYSQIEKFLSSDYDVEKIKNYITRDITSCNLVFDPFAGGGTIPLAAQILGFETKAIDLNPVAVLINKALTELPRKYINQKPILQNNQQKITNKYESYEGLAQDLELIGTEIFEELQSELSNIYPTVNKGKELFGLIWSRSIICPSPACQKVTPLINSLEISKNKKIVVVPYFDEKLRFKLSANQKMNKIKVGRGSNFKCVHCNHLIKSDYVKEKGQKNELKPIPTVAVIGSRKAREYLEATEVGKTQFKFEIFKELNLSLGYDPRAIWCPAYGLNTFYDLFLNRQLFVLTRFCEKIAEKHKKITDLCRENKADIQYANTIITYLSLALDRFIEYYNVLVRWRPDTENSESIFSRAGIPMIWDFTEINPFNESNTQVFVHQVKKIANVLRKLPRLNNSEVLNVDASSALKCKDEKIIVSTDPPYYDNIGYSDVSDFFYVWLRINLGKIYPDLFATMLTPKKEEIVAIASRFNGNKNEAANHFKFKFSQTMQKIANLNCSDYPVTIYYAFKQEEKMTDKDSGDLIRASTGWETMLEGIINSGLQITGTLPIRTETLGRAVSINTNSLASCIVLVCRKKMGSDSIATRREFIGSLKKELPSALKSLQEAGIAPVDLAQAFIGPGMSVFSRYSKVLEADGNTMSIKTALQIINQELDLYLAEQESEWDKETRFSVAWYEQYGWNEGPFGDANTLATAKGTAVNALEQAGVIFAKAGKVKLIKRSELADDWDPRKDKKLTVWECVNYLIKVLEDKGELGASEILRKIGGLSEPVMELSYRLYAICDKKGWAEDGFAFNNLISSWQSITDKAQFGEISESRKKDLKDKAQKTLDEL